MHTIGRYVRAAAVAAMALAGAAPALAQTGEEAGRPDAPRVIRSWTSDRRHFQPGDLITVLIDEYTLASADRANTALDDRSRRASLDVGDRGDRTGLGRVVDLGVRSTNTGESRERGVATRRDRFTAELTVRVVGVEPDGSLRVEGARTLRIDNHEQEVRLSGWVRPADISARNVVESWRIANASIEYRSTGKLSTPRAGILSRLIGWIWP
ncbi:MAG TPA: flagellar basal body L-ring protein FlgH [Longimicrobiales bacterium]|nr:flagellar basal body L-ring protein FlgH [Longimicrobiales bacterium]